MVFFRKRRSKKVEADGPSKVAPDTPDTHGTQTSTDMLRSLSVARSATGDFEIGFEDEVRKALFIEETEEEAFRQLMKTESRESKSLEDEEDEIIKNDKPKAPPVIALTKSEVSEDRDQSTYQTIYTGKDTTASVWKSFSCAELPNPNVSLFYDKVCAEESKADDTTRPYYNNELAIKFVKHTTSRGFDILYWQAPHSAQNPTDDWKGRSVTMLLEPGTNGDRFAIQPKIVWSTMPGGHHTSRIKTSISLLRIHSIDTTVPKSVPENDGGEDDEDMCFISITTDEGNVHLFEATSVAQRDMIAKGLRNIVARLAFQLVIGDVSATEELYDSNSGKGPEQELHSLAIPRQNLDRIAHILLD